MKHQFHLTPKWKRYYAIMALLFFVGVLAIIYILFFTEPGSVGLLEFILFTETGLFFLIGMTYFMEGYTQVITLTPNELQYERIGYKLHIDWIKFKQIKEFNRLFIRFEGICFDTSPDHIKVWSSGAFFSRSVLESKRSKSELDIPLMLFGGENWRDSELGAQIKQYAPHLFKEKSAQSAD